MWGVAGIIINKLTEHKPCKQCEIYKQWLNAETEQKEYLQKLLLHKAGYLQASEEETTLDTAEYPSLGKRNTLSHMRQIAQKDSHRRKLEEDKVAKDSDLTSGEKLFQDSLTKIS